MVFGQLVIGPPGSGKTTYCHGMLQYLSALGRRVAIVNLDPANDVLPYTPAVDVADLVCLDTVMEELHLGPNGGEGSKQAVAAEHADTAAPDAWDCPLFLCLFCAASNWLLHFYSTCLQLH
jgi:hypothetical protein